MTTTSGASLALGLLWLLLQLSITSFISWGHYAAAIGMLLCIFFVTVRSATQAPAPNETPMRKLYSVIAAFMLLAGGGGLFLWRIELITLFWFEIAVAAAFLAFWIAQTFAPRQRT